MRRTLARARDADRLPSLLLKNCSHIATFDAEERELVDADIAVVDRRITAVGPGLEPPAGAEVVDARGWIVLPGMVNAHQHLYQIGLRALPELERAPILPWLRGVTNRCLSWWRDDRLTPETVGALAAAGMVESLLGGTTTVADQHYFFPGPGPSIGYIEATIEAAHEVGIRLNAGRGTITLGVRQGGTAADIVTQSVDEVLRHSQALIDAHHDPAELAAVRIDLAPCGVHVDRPELFREFAALAGEHPGVGLHTHLYEVVDTGFAAAHYGRTPWEILVDNGWAVPHAWLAHVNDPPAHELAEFAAAGVGIAHLTAPDLKMGWGRAPLRDLLDAGCRVGFGTTGSSSNDGGNMLGDLRLAALVHRDDPDPARWPTSRELLRMATRGSAEIVGRPELGRIEAGAGADLACWDLTTVDRVGIGDPMAGLIHTGLSDRATFVTVGGRVVVRDGRCTTVDERAVAERANRLLRTNP
jgi:cytosine/adenosine deaminase-related metal-dependent hydrolase